MLQSVDAAAGASLRAPDGEPVTFEGLVADAEGNVRVRLGRRGAGIALEQLDATALARRLGAAGVVDLVVAARGEPSIGDYRNAPTWLHADLTDVGSTTDGLAPLLDLPQGEVGDCYFLSTLISWVNADRTALGRLVTRSADGNAAHVDGHFFVPTAAGVFAPVTITSDGRLPVTAPFLSRGVASRVVLRDSGLALAEKLWAILHGEFGSFSDNPGASGYRGIQSGRPGDVMAALLGHAAQHLRFNSSNTEQVWRELDAVQSGGLAVLSTYPEGMGALALNLLQPHAYSVLNATTTADGERRVTLRNPWGKSALPHGNVFELSFQEVLGSFREIDYAAL